MFWYFRKPVYRKKIAAALLGGIALLPGVHLGVGSGTHGVQTARALELFECYLLGLPTRPAGIVVVGDVNSTLACALAAAKLNICVAHVEAGLRSFDRSMPEV